MFGRRLVPGLLASGAALALLAGCGGGGGGGDSQIALSPVAAVERAVETAAEDSAAYTFEMGAAGMNLRGSGSYRGGENPVARMVLDHVVVAGTAMAEGMEFRLVDDVMYLRFAEGLVPGAAGEWVKLPVEEFRSSGNFLGGLDPTLADPREQLRKMLDTEDVRELGTETIDGAATTHYRAEVQPESTGTVTERRSSNGDDLGPELEAILEDRLAESFGLGEPAQIDVWVDGDYRVRKLVAAMPMPMLGEASMTMQFRDFGSDVDVQAPADAKDFDSSDLLTDALGGQLGDLGDFGDFDADALEKELRDQIEGSLSEELKALIRSS